MLAPPPLPTVDLDALIVDEPDRETFHVRKDVFTDPAVFDLELTRIFEGTWIFIGLASQAPAPNDFFTFTIGRQPVLVSRGADGTLRCFYNSCRHRGSLICSLAQGSTPSASCAAITAGRMTPPARTSASRRNATAVIRRRLPARITT